MRDFEVRANWTDRYRLCFAKKSIAFFCDADPSEVTGDDWDDAPWYSNASRPYSHAAYTLTWDGPHVDVEETNGKPAMVINARREAWLVDGCYSDAEDILAGCTVREFVQKIQAAGGKVYAPIAAQVAPSRGEEQGSAP